MQGVSGCQQVKVLDNICSPPVQVKPSRRDTTTIVDWDNIEGCMAPVIICKGHVNHRRELIDICTTNELGEVGQALVGHAERYAHPSSDCSPSILQELQAGADSPDARATPQSTTARLHNQRRRRRPSRRGRGPVLFLLRSALLPLQQRVLAFFPSHIYDDEWLVLTQRHPDMGLPSMLRRDTREPQPRHRKWDSVLIRLNDLTTYMITCTIVIEENYPMHRDTKIH